MAIPIPTAIPIAFALDGNSYGLTAMVSLGAVLDGAIFGDHCSPISDTTILSATATFCDRVLHTRTQLPYSLFIAAIALLCACVPSALGLGPLCSFALGIAAILMVLLTLSRRSKAETQAAQQPAPEVAWSTQSPSHATGISYRAGGVGGRGECPKPYRTPFRSP